jgi:hypothetical protein
MIMNIAYVDASSTTLMLPVPDAPTVLVPCSGVPLRHSLQDSILVTHRLTIMSASVVENNR